MQRMITILVVGLSVLLSGINPTHVTFANENLSDNIKVNITDFSIIKENGDAATSITAGARYKLSIAWDASAYENTLHEGDFFKVALPDEFKFPTNHSATHFNLYTEEGDVIAAAVVNSNGDPGGGEVTITFSDYVERRHDVKGRIELSSTLRRSAVTTGQMNTFSIRIDSQVFEYNVWVKEPGVAAKVDPNETLYKRASKSESTDKYTQWSARINFAGHSLTNVFLTDTVHTVNNDYKSQYIPDSFVLEERVYDEYGNSIGTVERWTLTQLGGRLIFDEDLTSFTLSLNDLEGKQLYLRYRTTYSPGLILKNEMTLASNQNTWSDEYEYTEASSGGVGGGKMSGRIRIIKKEFNSDVTLAGAVFKIRKKSTGEEFVLTTDANGEAVFERLPEGEYEIAEINAPEGYLLNEQLHHVTVTAANPTSIEISNIPLLEIPVRKIWVGEYAGELEITLKADGESIEKKTITSNDNWEYTFSNLPKFDPVDGHKIMYDVDEEKIDGFISEKTGSAEKGFTFKNVISAKTTLTVKKVWEGPKKDKAIIDLLADGKWSRSVILSESNDWNYTFTDLEQYDNGEKINYTIKERAIRGYTANITGSPDIGYTVTNTNKEMKTLSVRKKWIGGSADKIKLRLYANGRQVSVAEVTRSSGWKHEFRDLPVYKKDGERIRYSISEDKVDGYVSKITEVSDGRYIIINTRKPENPTEVLSKPPNSDENGRGNPKTGDHGTVIVNVISLLAAAGIFAAYFIRKRVKGE